MDGHTNKVRNKEKYEFTKPLFTYIKYTFDILKRTLFPYSTPQEPFWKHHEAINFRWKDLFTQIWGVGYF